MSAGEVGGVLYLVGAVCMGVYQIVLTPKYLEAMHAAGLSNFQIGVGAVIASLLWPLTVVRLVVRR